MYWLPIAALQITPNLVRKTTNIYLSVSIGQEFRNRLVGCLCSGSQERIQSNWTCSDLKPGRLLAGSLTSLPYGLLTQAASVKEKIIRTLVKMVRNYFIRGYCNREERAGSTLNAAKTAGNLQPRSRVRGSVDGKLLRGDMRGRGILAKGRPRAQISNVGK